MPEKKSTESYDKLDISLRSGKAGSFYIFHGEESYLRDRSLEALRKLLCPGGLDGFDYKRIDGREFSVDAFEGAIETLPAFAERTLIEVHDFDIFKAGEDSKRSLGRIFSSLPDYVCVVLIFDVIAYKPDSGAALNQAILKHAEIVEFVVQEQTRLVRWITKHYADAGKRISASDAAYLIFITGGLMSSMGGEIEKSAAYAMSETVTRADIDMVVTPVLNAAAYKLTDALARREYGAAMKILDDLLRMKEEPHKILFSISLNMRQLLAARICVENNLDRNALKKMSSIRYEFQARTLIDTARKVTLADCRAAVLCCAGTAFDINSSPEPEARLTELVARLAFNYKGNVL